MCNAYRHYDGCTCGFGGEGHLGGGYGGGYSGAVFYRYDSSMRQLARDLGYSVTFPTCCRYCGEDIWLFADPNGGFAIFDDLGPPWPKHECWGIHPESPRYTLMDPSFEKSGRFPVPKGTQAGTLTPNAQLTGTIVELGQAGSTATVFDGTRVYHLYLPNAIPLGATVTGTVDTISQPPRLRDVHLWDLPTLPSIRREFFIPPSQPTELKGVRSVDVWRYQQDAAELRGAHPEISDRFSMALDALLNGFTLTALAILVGILRTVSDNVPAVLKARYASTVFRALGELRLEPLADPIWGAISRGVRASVEGDQKKEIDRILQAGQLRSKLESRERVIAQFASRCKKEGRYLKALASRHPEITEMIAWLEKRLKG